MGTFGVSGVAIPALTLNPPENFNLAVFNLAINGQIRQLNRPLYGTPADDIMLIMTSQRRGYIPAS